MATIDFTLNGKPVRVEPRADESLLDALRERCGVHSTKDGCAPQGQCGCCLAIVGGRAVTTCAMPASKAAGQEISVAPEALQAQIIDLFEALKRSLSAEKEKPEGGDAKPEVKKAGPKRDSKKKEATG